MATKESGLKVSIIIPVYNGAEYLKASVDSALAQTYENIEVIVVNDGSNDEGRTEEIAKSYGDKIRYYAKPNGGVASALNYGIDKMEGDYFSWLSHDDLYEPTKVEDEVSLAESLDSKTIVVCNAKVLYKSGVKKKTAINKAVFSNFALFLALDAEVGINGCTLLIPRQALVESGGFNTNLPVTQDYDLWYRLCSRYKYKFALLEKDLVIYRRHDGQDSVQKQQLCLEAGDELRSGILREIGIRRLNEELSVNKEAVGYALKNYELYKERGHVKTASLILYGLLQYMYDCDEKKFYDLYFAELETELTHEPKRNASERIVSARSKILDEYGPLMQKWPATLPIKRVEMVDALPPTNTIHRAAWILKQSVRRDGAYLTIEKALRAARKKLAKKT